MKQRNLKLGIFFTGSVLVLIVALFVIGARQNLFKSNIVLKTYFKNAMGLQEGSTVRYVGITIGSVEDVSIVDDTSVFVSLKISKDHATYIFKNAVAEINSDGLMGNKMINIVPGKQAAKPVEDGDEIASSQPVGIESVMNSLLNNSKNLEQITSELAKITTRINSGEGLVGRLLFDQKTSNGFDEIMINANDIVSDMKNVSDEINNGNGLIGKLINDKSMAQNMQTIMDSLSSATASISNVAGEMNQFADKVNNGNGAMSKMVNDSTLAYDLGETIANAKERTSELEETIALVNDSWILNLFRKKDKQKAKDKEFVEADYE